MGSSTSFTIGINSSQNLSKSALVLFEARRVVREGRAFSTAFVIVYASGAQTLLPVVVSTSRYCEKPEITSMGFLPQLHTLFAAKDGATQLNIRTKDKITLKDFLKIFFDIILPPRILKYKIIVAHGHAECNIFMFYIKLKNSFN